MKSVPIPTPKKGETLVRLLRTSLNQADFDFVNGHPLVRFTGPFKPGYPILGSDCIGIIESIKGSSTTHKINDKVWADLSNPLHYGCFAEYVCVPLKSLLPLPDTVDLNQAACLPSAGVGALQNIDPNMKKNDKVFVIGAGGGIGTILVQLFKT